MIGKRFFLVNLLCILFSSSLKAMIFSLDGYHPVVLQPKGDAHASSFPRLPSRQKIECSYEDGTLFISFGLPEGEAELKVLDEVNGDVIVAPFDTQVPLHYYIGEIDGEKKIEVTTANGNTYEGWLTE